MLEILIILISPFLFLAPESGGSVDRIGLI